MTPPFTFRERFGAARALIGVLHVGALPGTPRAADSVDALVRRTVDEAQVYREAGFPAVIIENMHDRPYLKSGVGPEITAAMTAIGYEVKRQTGLVMGVQVLAGANREALAIAHACGADFVRVEGFVFAHVAEEGLIESCELPLLDRRHRKPRDSVAAHRPYPEFLSELNRNGREVERVVVRITDEILHLQRVRIDLDDA